MTEPAQLLERSHERDGQPRVYSRRDLRDRIDVFEDRTAAGRMLGQMLSTLALKEPLLLAIPAGGVPVAVAVAEELGVPLDVAVTSKITLPWNTEAGYGAVAFDGSVVINEALVRECSLSPADVERGVASTQSKVQRRVARLRGARPPLSLAGKTVILVDDGLASGFTMRAAIAACRRTGAERIIVAVPTAHDAAVTRLLPEADLIVCANVRSGPRFAVADAYQSWQDVPEALAELALERVGGVGGGRH